MITSQPPAENISTNPLSRLFPLWNLKNIRLYYLLVAFNNSWFIAGNWIFFWTKFMTFKQLGVVDASAFAFGLLLEIPSGAVSDLFGKKKTLVMAMLSLTIGTFMMAMSTSLAMLWIAFFIAQIGFAFYSGAAEALAYDTLVEHERKEDYDQVAATTSTVASIASVTATLLGGILYAIHFRLSHLAWAVTYFLALVVALNLKEPKVDTLVFSFKGYFAQLVEGVKQLIKPKIRPFLIVILMLMGAEYVFDWGFVKPAMAKEFGFLDKEQAIIFALLSIVAALVIRSMPTIRKLFSDKKGLYLLTLVMGAGFLLAFLPLGYFGIIPLLLIHTSGALAYPWVSVVINDEIPSQYRATTLSTVALITKIPYVVIAIWAGNMVQQGQLNIFNLYVGMAIVFSIISSITALYLKKVARKF